MNATISEIPTETGYEYLVQCPAPGYARVQTHAGGPADVPHALTLASFETLEAARAAYPWSRIVGCDGLEIAPASTLTGAEKLALWRAADLAALDAGEVDSGPLRTHANNLFHAEDDDFAAALAAESGELAEPLYRIEPICGASDQRAIVDTETGDTRWQGPAAEAQAELDRMTQATIALRAGDVK